VSEIIPIETKTTVMVKSGATRERSWVAVSKALDATKMTVDKYGEEHIEEDHAIRLRAAELIARAVGDIKADGTTVNIQNNSISMDASEFRAILEKHRTVKPCGQTGEVIDVESYRA